MIVAIILLIALPAAMIALSSLAYRRRAGVAAGTGRGAPPSPVAMGAIGLLAAIAAVGVYFLVAPR